MIKEVDEKEFSKEILDEKKIVLVDFFATWCGPCQMLAPILSEIAEEYNEIKIVKVDIDKARDLAIKNRVEAVPTMIIYKDGKVAKRMEGYRGKDVLIEELMNLK